MFALGICLLLLQLLDLLAEPFGVVVLDLGELGSLGVVELFALPYLLVYEFLLPLLGDFLLQLCLRSYLPCFFRCYSILSSYSFSFSSSAAFSSLFF